MKVSILIPCYNAEKWIGEAIRSALAQTHKDKEVIVFDDGSIDGSLDVIRSFGEQITWASGRNSGGNVARNHLLKSAKGDWVQYLDADDYLESNHVARQIECVQLHPEARVIYSPTIYEYWNEHEPMRREIQNLQSAIWSVADDEQEEINSKTTSHDPYILMAHWMLPQTGAVLLERQTLLQIGGWKPDQPCCQENELFLRLFKAGQEFVFCPHAGAVYRQWSQTTVCRRNPLQTFTVRQGIVRDMENYLRQQGDLTDARREAIAHSRIQCARSIYHLDRRVAIELAQEALKNHPDFRLPPAPYFPLLYRIVFRAFGFLAAERLADFVRRFRTVRWKSQ